MPVTWHTMEIMQKPDVVDLLIIGAGPAGLTAAQYGSRANLNTLIVEQLVPGGQALLIDVAENYPGNTEHRDSDGRILTPPRSGFELIQDMVAQAKTFGASFLDEEVTGLLKENDRFTALLSGGSKINAGAVIIATGAQHRNLDVPGEEKFTGRGVSYCASCDGAFFKGKKIFVAGGGDAACDEAQYLSRLSNQVIMVHRRDRLRAQKAVADRVLSNPNITVRFNTVIKEIKGDTKVTSVALETAGKENGPSLYEESADAVFIFAGYLPRSSLVSGGAVSGGIKAETDNSGYIITNQKMATGVPGLFAAGDVRSGSFRQVIVAAGEGAVAAHSAEAYIDEQRGTAYN